MVNLNNISSNIGAKIQEEINAIRKLVLNKVLTISSLLGIVLVTDLDIIN
jgi:hypothetical protein